MVSFGLRAAVLEDRLRNGRGLMIFLCCAAVACKSPPVVEAPVAAPPKVEEPKAYHAVEFICGNASATVAGNRIRSVVIAQEPATRKKLIVEVHLDEEGMATLNALIRRNRGKELSIIIPDRIVLVGRMDREIEDGKVSVSSYSQAVAEEIRELLIKE